MNTKIKFELSLVFLILVSQVATVFAQVETRTYYADEGLLPREHNVDFTHLKLELAFETDRKLVKGKATHRFVVLQQQIDSLFLDAIDMTFKEVMLDGKSAKFKKSAKGICIYFEPQLDWDSEHKLQITYEATPSKGLYFVGWDSDTNKKEGDKYLSRKQIWTQGQGINNRHWIPMFDEKNDKLITETIVEFDAEYEVLSNGEKLKEKSIGNGKKLWHYKMSHPHSSYLIMLGIGEYAIDSEKSGSGIPLNYYYYPDQAEQLKPTYRFSKQMFDWFEKEIGVPYPWEPYSQIPVQDFMYGAMENTTATIFGDFYLVDERSYLDKNYVRVNAHELAHQWFGDMVTARASAHHWLQESFATHYDMMYQKEAFGADHFDWVRRNYNNQSLAESEKNLKPLAHSQAGTVRHYPKGAFVLQMLKYVVGRDQYNAAVQYYLKKHAYSNVDSKNLLIAFHERLGLSLNWFWEDWIYRGGEPHYEVNFKTAGDKGTFFLKQVHSQNDLVDLFKMPIFFEIFFKDGTKSSRKVWIERQSHEVDFELGTREVDYVLFDPNSKVMKKVVFEKNVEQLKSQAVKAEHMIDRYDAIVALASFEFEGKKDFLKSRFQSESFHGIKGEIISQLLPDLDESSEEVTLMAIGDHDAEVRKAMLNGTIRISTSLEPEYRKLLNDSSYQVIEKALELLTFYVPENANEYLELTKNEIGNRSHNVRITWLKIAYSLNAEEKWINELVNYSSNHYEFTTRINAFNALQEINYLDEEGLKNALEASFSFNNRLVGPANNCLRHFFEQSTYKKMILNYVASQSWTDNEFKKVSKYLVY
jgi:aminopeptidase N